MALDAQLFKFEAPEVTDHPRIITKLCQTDRIVSNVQVISKGGENRLHSHPHLDGFWMVLRGKARFHGEGDKVLGELGPMEGIMVPRNFKYWFEAAGDEPLHLLQVEAAEEPFKGFSESSKIKMREGIVGTIAG